MNLILITRSKPVFYAVKALQVCYRHLNYNVTENYQDSHYLLSIFSENMNILESSPNNASNIK